MRVTIEHREQTTGIIGRHKDCYIDCKVEFSEEERAIIKARDLYGESFTIRTSTAPPSNSAFYSTTFMRPVGAVLAVGGLVYAIINSFGTDQGKSNFGVMVMFVGIGVMIWGWIRAHREDKRLDNVEQTITVKRLLSNPLFTVHAWNAGYAKPIEEEIRGHLTGLKNIIANSAELRAKQTFEL